MTITALPTPPTRSDPTNFASRADTFLAALPTFATEANALAAAMNLNATTDTSTTSNLIGTGSKTFTVSSGKSFQPGMYLMLADTAAPSTNAMIGQVTSYSGTSLVVNVKAVIGSGTKTAWTISQSVPTADMGVFTTLQATSGIDSTAIGATTPSTGKFTTLEATGTTTLSGGTANGVAYLNASKVLTSGSALTFNGTNLFANGLRINGADTSNTVYQSAGALGITCDGPSINIGANNASGYTTFGIASVEKMRLSSTGLAVTGKVGITSSTVDALIVTGPANVASDLTDGTGVLRMQMLSNVPHIGSYTNHNVNFITNNTVKATLDTPGNFGLGITPSAWSQGKTIEVGSLGNAIWGNATADMRLFANCYYNAGYKYAAANASGNAQMLQMSGSALTHNSATTGAAVAAGDPITWTATFSVNKDKTFALQGATSAAGTGIAFPATQLASADSNTLDDYREGTWTPTQGAGLTVTGAFSSSGTYTKVGRQVTAYGTVSGATSVAVSAAGVITSNLPFTSANNSVGAATNNTNSASVTVQVSGVTLYANGAITATPVIFFTITYFV